MASTGSADCGAARRVIAEAELYGPRWEMVQAFARANRLDAIEVDARRRLARIVAAGTTFDDARQALLDLGLDRATLPTAPASGCCASGMLHPLGAEPFREFAARPREARSSSRRRPPFVETQVRDILYGTPSAPAVLGKRDARRARRSCPPTAS